MAQNNVTELVFTYDFSTGEQFDSPAIYNPNYRGAIICATITNFRETPVVDIQLVVVDENAGEYPVGYLSQAITAGPVATNVYPGAVTNSAITTAINQAIPCSFKFSCLENFGSGTPSGTLNISINWIL